MRHVSLTGVRGSVLALLAGLMIVGLPLGRAFAQGAARNAQTVKAQDVEAYKKQAEDLKVETKDGVFITATYWRSKTGSKDAPVVMLLHAERQNRLQWFRFAKILHDAKELDADGKRTGPPLGFAVVAVDFRGHGDSRQISKTREPGKWESIRGDSISELDVFGRGANLADLLNDVMAVKESLLFEENNANRLNVRRLGVVGAGALGCYAAMEFARSEFANPRAGGDLSAVVLLNPAGNFRGQRVPTELGAGSENLPLLLVSTDARGSRNDAERLANRLRVPDLSKKEPLRDTHRKESGLFHVANDQTGTALLNPPVDKLDDQIIDNLTNRLVKVDRPWEAKKPGTFGSRRTD